MSSTSFFFILIQVIAALLLAINVVFAPHKMYPEKASAFECGFHSFLGQNRTQFSISFFIFGLLFLLFDLEILLVYPYVVSAYTNDIYGLVIMLIFFLALTLGFAFELGKNALKIDSRQTLTLKNKSQHNTISQFSKVVNLYHYKIVCETIGKAIYDSYSKFTFYYICITLGIFFSVRIILNLIYLIPSWCYVYICIILIGFSIEYWDNKGDKILEKSRFALSWIRENTLYVCVLYLTSRLFVVLLLSFVQFVLISLDIYFVNEYILPYLKISFLVLFFDAYSNVISYGLHMWRPARPLGWIPPELPSMNTNRPPGKPTPPGGPNPDNTAAAGAGSEDFKENLKKNREELQRLIDKKEKEKEVIIIEDDDTEQPPNKRTKISIGDITEQPKKRTRISINEIIEGPWRKYTKFSILRKLNLQILQLNTEKDPRSFLSKNFSNPDAIINELEHKFLIDMISYAQANWDTTSLKVGSMPQGPGSLDFFFTIKPIKSGHTYATQEKMKDILIKFHSDDVGDWVYVDGPSPSDYVKWAAYDDAMRNYIREHPLRVRRRPRVSELLAQNAWADSQATEELNRKDPYPQPRNRPSGSR